MENAISEARFVWSFRPMDAHWRKWQVQARPHGLAIAGGVVTFSSCLPITAGRVGRGEPAAARVAETTEKEERTRRRESARNDGRTHRKAPTELKKLNLW